MLLWLSGQPHGSAACIGSRRRTEGGGAAVAAVIRSAGLQPSPGLRSVPRLLGEAQERRRAGAAAGRSRGVAQGIIIGRNCFQTKS